MSSEDIVEAIEQGRNVHCGYCNVPLVLMRDKESGRITGVECPQCHVKTVLMEQHFPIPMFMHNGNDGEEDV